MSKVVNLHGEPLGDGDSESEQADRTVQDQLRGIADDMDAGEIPSLSDVCIIGNSEGGLVLMDDFGDTPAQTIGALETAKLTLMLDGDDDE